MPKRATIHQGKTWWVIPDGAIGFNHMRHGFTDRAAALAWAQANGYVAA